MTISNFTLLATITCVGLVAGLFYSYSCSVIPGLSKLPDAQYLSAMQSINRAIQNPVFFISFFGSLILLPVSAYLKYSQPTSLSFWLLLTAAGIYIIGAFCVTAFGNIPLNNVLDKFDIVNASKEAAGLQRTAFESKWNSLHFVRTVSSITSFIILIIACLMNNDIK